MRMICSMRQDGIVLNRFFERRRCWHSPGGEPLEPDVTESKGPETRSAGARLFHRDRYGFRHRRFRRFIGAGAPDEGLVVEAILKRRLDDLEIGRQVEIARRVERMMADVQDLLPRI